MGHRAIFWAVAALAILSVLAVTPTATATPPAPQYFSLDAGSVSESFYGATDLFSVTEFVLGEPVGLPANLTVTNEIWQTLQVSYVGNSTPFANWSVTEAAAGRFLLDLNLTVGQVGQLEAGGAMLELTGSAVVGNASVGAGGAVTGTTLLSATPPANFWEDWFGIPTPPGFNSPQDVIETLADLDASVAGRALYMAVTLIAATVYVYTAHKLTRERISGGRDKATEGRRAKEGSS